MADKTDVLSRIIQSSVGNMGSTFGSGMRREQSPEESVSQIRAHLGQSRPVAPDDFGGRVPRTPAAPAIQPDFTPPRDPMADFSPVSTDAQAYNPSSNSNANPARAVFGDAAIDAIPSRPQSAQAATPAPDAVAPPPPADTPAPQQGLLPQNPDIMFAPPPPGQAAANPVVAAAAAQPSAPQPQDVAAAGLIAAGQGQSLPIDPMAPEQFDPETGLRNEPARKLGLLERMFGEDGSDKRASAGKALMMAGAAIMTTDGNVGEAIGSGIQAGLMTYDQAMQAIKDEEAEARKLGMTEEAHALNMELKRLQLRRAEGGGTRGPVKAAPEYTPAQKGMMLADTLIQFGYSPEEALRFGGAEATGLSPTLARLPQSDPMDFVLGD